MTLCVVENVTKSYGEGPARVDALRGVSTEVGSGEFTVISGPSGSGKSTLLNLIGCLDTPTTGSLRIEGREVARLTGPEVAKLRADRIGFIFQSFNLIPVLSALENVQLALQLAGDTADVAARSTAALASVGLADMVHRRPSQLSGGQQQRVAIARALVKNPALVIADEPTANLDSKTGAAVLDIMQRMNAERNITFLFSTHDPAVTDRAKRILTLTDGQIVGDEVR